MITVSDFAKRNWDCSYISRENNHLFYLCTLKNNLRIEENNFGLKSIIAVSL